MYAVLAAVLLFIGRRLSNGFGRFNQKILELTSGDCDLTKKVEDNSGTEFEVIAENAAGISAVTQELSASMQVLTDTMGKLDAASGEMLMAVDHSQQTIQAGSGLADEIRELADNSRETAGNIQSISQQVITAVRSLMESSEHLIRILNESVLPDYAQFLQVADNYASDAGQFAQMLGDYAAGMGQMRGNIHILAEIAENISNTVTDCNQGIAEAAKNTSRLAMELSDISRESVQLEAEADRMKEETARYRTE